METLYLFAFYFFIGFTFINCGYYCYLARFCFGYNRQTQKGNASLPPISVLVCAKNEAENLKKNIPGLLQQDYPDFEIILINDASNDGSLNVMNAFSKASPKIKIVDFIPNNSGNKYGKTAKKSKKNALTKGIESAKYNHLLLLDADCYPKSEQWIKIMASGFSAEKSIVLGYGAYEKISGSWLNRIIRFETLLTALQYFGYAKNKNPYMGVGRNLGYTKQLFEQQSGFMGHLHIAAGDDDLFINRAATSTNTAIVYRKQGHTVSEPKKTWKAWFLQKRRHTGVAHFYKPKHKVQLGLFYGSQFVFLSLYIPFFFLTHFSLIILITVFIRYLIVWTVIAFGAKKLSEKNLIYYFPLVELFLIPLQLGIFISNLISRPKHWN